jgi:hypothetical protein
MAHQGKHTGLILALAAGASAAAAARKSGCSRATVFRCLQKPKFRRAVAQARGQVLGRATAMLAQTSTLAVRSLRKLLEDENASVRRMAARSVLDSLARLTDQTDIEERLSELEAALLEEKETKKGEKQS